VLVKNIVSVGLLLPGAAHELRRHPDRRPEFLEHSSSSGGDGTAAGTVMLKDQIHPVFNPEIITGSDRL
jgi:hypothetical protein